ncbi:hypothetical protein P7C70_g4729, partial [Phenoliferia sp. Uapishka_3]
MFTLRNLVDVVSPLFTRSPAATQLPPPKTLSVGTSHSTTEVDNLIAQAVALSPLINLDSPTLPLQPASNSLHLLQATHSRPESACEYHSHNIPTIAIDTSFLSLAPLIEPHLEHRHYTASLPQPTLNLLVPTPGVHDHFYGSPEEVAKAAARKAARKARKLERAEEEAARKQKEARREAERKERERVERVKKVRAALMARKIQDWV